jgi:hypothetical protein
VPGIAAPVGVQGDTVNNGERVRLADVPAPADLGVALAADRCDTATRAPGHRFVVMPQVSWQTMMSEFPAAAHVVTGLLPSEDAAAGLGRVRGFLLGRLARALPVSRMYAIAEIV